MQNLRTWTNMAVGALLLAILLGGGIMISHLNKDAQELQLNGELAIKGQEISRQQGCIACHTVDGSEGVGPSWAGMFGKTEKLQDGSEIIVDEAYFMESIINPSAKLVEGYPNVMLRYYLDDSEMQALLEFARQLASP